MHAPTTFTTHFYHFKTCKAVCVYRLFFILFNLSIHLNRLLLYKRQRKPPLKKEVLSIHVSCIKC